MPAPSSAVANAGRLFLGVWNPSADWAEIAREFGVEAAEGHLGKFDLFGTRGSTSRSVHQPIAGVVFAREWLPVRSAAPTDFSGERESCSSRSPERARKIRCFAARRN